jgi:DNA-binding PadR family transcriptional regulator
MKRFSQSIFDLLQKYPNFIMMIRQDPVLPIDDTSAETLYNIWKGSSGKDAKNISKLVDKGYIRKTGEIIELTEKGKNLILEMGLSSPNSFAKTTMPTYSEIKTKSAKRERKTFIKKASFWGPPKVDLRKNHDLQERTEENDGTLYLKGNIVQVWWDKIAGYTGEWTQETWTLPSRENALEVFQQRTGRPVKQAFNLKRVRTNDSENIRQAKPKGD